MNDKELLELAARAAISAGMPIIQTNAGPQILERKLSDSETYGIWRPLTDDGDRYRLARTLGFAIDFELHTVGATIAGEHHLFQWGGKIDEAHAFVIAAAEIGRNTQ